MRQFRIMGIFIGCAILCAVATSADQSEQQEVVSVQKLMTPEEFKAYGLNKLTEEELQGLSQWLSQHAPAPLPEFGNAQGRVLFEDGTPATGLTVHIHQVKPYSKPCAAHTVVDSSGRWFIRNLEPGSYVVGSSHYALFLSWRNIDERSVEAGKTSDFGVERWSKNIRKTD